MEHFNACRLQIQKEVPPSPFLNSLSGKYLNCLARGPREVHTDAIHSILTLSYYFTFLSCNFRVQTIKQPTRVSPLTFISTYMSRAVAIVVLFISLISPFSLHPESGVFMTNFLVLYFSPFLHGRLFIFEI